MGRWKGGGVGSGGGLEAVGRLKQTLKHKCQYCVGDPNWHDSLGRPGLPLESAWHPMQSY